MDQSNKKIHSANDTLQSAGGDAKHAVKFAKLGTAFVIELSN
jgi:leucyl aminopeptidase